MAKERSKNSTTASLGFEAKLWAAADALRNNMDAAEYKHVVVGLIIADARHGECVGVDSKLGKG
jgi:type I restriction enzyme M protein